MAEMVTLLRDTTSVGGSKILTTSIFIATTTPARDIPTIRESRQVLYSLAGFFKIQNISQINIVCGGYGNGYRRSCEVNVAGEDFWTISGYLPSYVQILSEQYSRT